MQGSWSGRRTRRLIKPGGAARARSAGRLDLVKRTSVSDLGQDVCAVTGQKIPLEQLRYWSAKLQEAYAGPTESLKRWQETHR